MAKTAKVNGKNVKVGPQKMSGSRAQLELKKRQCVIRMVACIAIFVAICLVKVVALSISEEFGNNPILSAMIYISAVVLAGFMGYGARDYVRASDAIKALDAKKSKKKNK